MNIPGDTGHPWRLNKFIEYYSLGDTDMNFPLLARYADNHNLSINDRFWMSFLYSCCYCVPTTCFLFEALPLSTLTMEKAESVWKLYKKPLIFQTDKRYVKNMNWFLPMVEDWLGRVGRKPAVYFKRLEEGSPLETYNNLYSEISGWKYFGRFTIFLLIEAIHKLTPLKATADWFEWKKGNTATSGVMHILYLDKEAEEFDATGSLSLDQLELLTKRLPQIIRAVSKKGLTANILDLETAFCGFRKLFKATRYGGYYIDRVQTEIASMQQNLPDHYHIWDELWSLRLEAFDHKLLGEVQGRQGLQKKRYKDWIEKGVVGIENLS